MPCTCKVERTKNEDKDGSTTVVVDGIAIAVFRGGDVDVDDDDDDTKGMYFPSVVVGWVDANAGSLDGAVRDSSMELILRGRVVLMLL